MSPLILLTIGLLLIFIEFYLPGAVLGIAGGGFVLASIILFIMQDHSIVEVILYIAAVVVCLTLLIRFALWKIKKAKPNRSIYSDDSQVGFQAVSFDKTMIGKEGVVLTDLKPGGFITINDKQYSAISEEGYLSKGTKVKVIRGEESNLIVRRG